MHEDGRLFSANSPIGRFWYYLNLFLLAFLAVSAHIGILNYVLPAANPSYHAPIKAILYFIYFILAVTFFMLLDRRIFDIAGSRDSGAYQFISKISSLVIFLLILSAAAYFKIINIPESYNSMLIIPFWIFIFMVFILGLIPGKLTAK